MKVSATTKELKVSFRMPGKQYGVADGENRSPLFDEVTVKVGESFELPAGSELVAVTEMGGAKGVVITDESGLALIGAGIDVNVAANGAKPAATSY